MADDERALEKSGCPKINLQVRTTNEAARGFYAELGYAPDATVSLGDDPLLTIGTFAHRTPTRGRLTPCGN